MLRPSIVAERRNRLTGGTVYLIDADHPDNALTGGLDGEGRRWITFCDRHNTLCVHETKAVALGFLARPWEWCEECQFDTAK